MVRGCSEVTDRLDGEKSEQLESPSALSPRAGHLQTSLQLVTRKYTEYGALVLPVRSLSHNKQQPTWQLH